MKTSFPFWVLAGLLLLPLVGHSQDDVTIPKSRLQELERKEKELEKLKREQAPPAVAAPIPPQPTAAPTKTPPTQPIIQTPPPPPLVDLPPVKDGDTIEARDLGTYYAQDPAVADRRFKKRKLFVLGEICGFEKPMLRSNYRVLLQTAERDAPVVCDLLTPANFSAVFAVNHGVELVGLQGETRVPLAKVGQRVMVQGVCKGRADKSVLISAMNFKAVSGDRP
jgi:tRNA_anti-like